MKILLVEPLQNGVWKIQKYIKMKQPCGPAFSLLFIYLEMKLVSQGDICTVICIIAVFLIAKKWKQSYPVEG